MFNFVKWAKIDNNITFDLTGPEVIDICSGVQQRLTEGYIASPNYPDHYPTNADCMCTIQTDWSSKITLSFYDLLLETKQG